MRKPERATNDLELCRAEVEVILKKFNCRIYDRSEYCGCIIEDIDTGGTLNFDGNC